MNLQKPCERYWIRNKIIELKPYLVPDRKSVFGQKVAHMQGARNPETGVY
jgi:hypothetical protein